MLHLVIAAAIICGWPSSSLAQDAESPAAAEDASSSLPTVNVTAARIVQDIMELPQSVAIITAEDIEKMPATNIAEILARVPGLDLSFDTEQSAVAGMGMVSLRGESPGRTLVLINGVKSLDRNNEGSSTVLINPSQIERIEIIKGPASVLYGSEAIGGVINIITKKGGDKPIGFSTGMSFDTSTQGLMLNASVFGALANGFNYRFSADGSDVHERKVPSGSLDISGAPITKAHGSSYRNRNYAGQVGYDWSNYSINIQADRYENMSEESIQYSAVGTTKNYFPKNNRDTIKGTFIAERLTDYFAKLTLTTAF